MEYSKEMKDRMRDRLGKILDKKYETTMIFSLSQFETEFGFLWGHSKAQESLTKEEVLFKEKWRKVRNNILNNGNQQRRNAKAELRLHDVTWTRYQTTFLPKENIQLGDNDA